MSIGQRSYFRIDVMMRCKFKIIPAQEVPKRALPSDMPLNFIESFMMQDVMELDQKINDTIVRINESSSLLATALNLINSKISFLMETVDASQMIKSIPYRPVNLSGNGIAFDIDQDIDIDDKVDLLMKPLEDEDPILVRSSVVHIQPKEFGSINRVALTYDDLKEKDRQKLVFFIQAKEIELAKLSKQRGPGASRP